VKKFFNWVFVLAGCVGLFYFVGLIVPRTLTQGSKTTLKAVPEQLYAVVSDLNTWPEWHPDVASVQERPAKNENPVWRITERDGTIYEAEVQVREEPGSFQTTYTIDGSRYTLRFAFGWYGQGGRAQITRTVDTRDRWKRARAFLWSRNETAPIGLLNALAKHLGETVAAEENN
jgi:hypothetical protein